MARKGREKRRAFGTSVRRIVSKFFLVRIRTSGPDHGSRRASENGRRVDGMRENNANRVILQFVSIKRLAR
jgi:hypothetical protein